MRLFSLGLLSFLSGGKSTRSLGRRKFSGLLAGHGGEKLLERAPRGEGSGGEEKVLEDTDSALEEYYSTLKSRL
jgi:hypothetical protein